MDIDKKKPTGLLRTRLRASVAVGLTAFVALLAVRDALHPEHSRGWLLQLDFVLHGWLLTAANALFYGYLCWLAFWFVRGTHGRERVATVGWFTAILPLPLEILRPQWAVTIRYIETFGLLVALLAAIAILLDAGAVADPGGRTV